MRRLRDRAPTQFFRGTELPRLMTMVIMLGVLVLLIDMARKPSTWRWLAGDGGQQEQAVGESRAAGDSETRVAAPEPTSTGPTDLDPLEQDAAREEFEAVTDKTPLAPEEMPAYWRLMSWERRQSTDELLERAAADVTYNDLWQRSAQWRGKLLRMRVHLRQAIKLNDLPQNPLDVKVLYEVTGWTSDSWNWYWMIMPQLPPGMPVGSELYEEATFVGYFLKLQPYEDRQGKTRAMPVMIGRLIWHPSTSQPTAIDGEWSWPWYVAGLLAVLFVVRWTLALAGRGNRPAATAVIPRSDPRDVEAWLQDAERPPDDDFESYDDEVRTGGTVPWEMTGPPPPEE